MKVYLERRPDSTNSPQADCSFQGVLIIVGEHLVHIVWSALDSSVRVIHVQGQFFCLNNSSVNSLLEHIIHTKKTLLRSSNVFSCLNSLLNAEEQPALWAGVCHNIL